MIFLLILIVLSLILIYLYLHSGANLKALLKPVNKNARPLSTHLSPQSSQDNSNSGGGGDLNAPLLPPKPLREQAKALFQYEAQNDDELTFKAGDILNVISKDIEDKGWWKGELNGRIGVFPDNFVELIKPPPSSAENDMSSRPRKRYDLHKPPPPPPNKHASSTTNPPSTGLPLAKSESKGDVAGNNGSAKGASLSGKPATASPDSSYIEEINKYIVSNPLFIEKTSKFGRGNSVNNL